ncbi:MAG: response regulator [Byssovorax sp.]
MLVIAADADPLFHWHVEQSLAGSELEPKLTTTGGEALAVAEQAPGPFVLLFGWGLPDMDGVELCERLSRLRARRDRFVIAALGPGEAAELAAAVEAGADDVLLKPFSTEALLHRLRLAALKVASPSRTISRPREALREALESELGGEVVVRQGERVGRIHVSHGGSRGPTWWAGPCASRGSCAAPA